MTTTKYITLQHNDLTKRGAVRVGIFLKKIQDGSVFLTTKGEAILDKVQEADLEVGMYKSGFATKLKGKVKGSTVILNYPKDFYKTYEFGGKGAGSGTAAEDRYLSLFREEINSALLKESAPYINIKINGRVVKVSGIISTPKPATVKRAPKADFTLVDPSGKHVGWISHKAGSKPSDFQQYGGLSDSKFDRDEDVKSFMDDLLKKYPAGLASGISVMRKVKSTKVINYSIYGTDFGGLPGVNNVDEFHQGMMKLAKSFDYYVINSNHKGKNGEAINSPGYTPIYFARYTSDRGANVAGKFIANARLGVFPIGKAINTTIEI